MSANSEIVIAESELAIVKEAQSIIKTSYDDRMLVKQIVESIAVPKNNGYPVNMSDVLQIVRIATSMHLDPILGGIWGYKDKNGRLVCGVSKKGWQQALHSQPDYAGITFRNNGELKHKSYTYKDVKYDISYYESVTCIISKIRPDGKVTQYEGTAYFDEEFMANKEPWLQRPKRMLEGRAMTICASNCYGWGAFDIDEVKQIRDHAQMVDVEANATTIPAPTVASKAKTLIANERKENWAEELKKAKNKEELTAIWKKIPKSLQKDDSLIRLAQALACDFESEEEGE